ncbi:MAG: ECF-type sigma factor [Gemmataceae bacterium]|nr:ECF-type sigma factor [Gemmataceae bacterium]
MQSIQITHLPVIVPTDTLHRMSDVTRILSAIEQGDPRAAELLLPLVYDELRKLAAAKLSQEKPGQTLDATALVHEAYLRLVARDTHQTEAAARDWNSRGHFFAAAAEAMRRIVIENARRKRRLRHGGRQRLDLDGLNLADEGPDTELVALDEALDRLAAEDKVVAEVVKLRFFAGLTLSQTAEALGISLRTANRHWAYAKARLYQELHGDEQAAE